LLNSFEKPHVQRVESKFGTPGAEVRLQVPKFDLQKPAIGRWDVTRGEVSIRRFPRAVRGVAVVTVRLRVGREDWIRM
jgi:hypothetical protein